jgi:predicted GNAT family acetyltransferase
MFSLNCLERGREELNRSSHIRQLNRDDTDELLEFLYQDSYYNIFMVGNLENMGLAHPDLDYWGSFREGKLAGALMRYRVFWNVYDAGEADLRAFAWLMDRRRDVQALHGRDELIARLAKSLRDYEVREERRLHFCRLPELKPALTSSHSVRRATLADLPSLVAFYSEAEEMSRDEQSVRSCLEQGRIFVATTKGRITSAALTNTETQNLAMIGGVYTPLEFRHQGYANACMVAICQDLAADGKEACLCYDDPVAGGIYRRLGFKKIGYWRLLLLRPM